ncbi:unnamed protein product [Dibothriocephalus latus]|uniref:Fibronectin type-III domain-containing protein n=1 Tax=Dibothriocephalus latus TaxID=60516 RepID=A0A3P7PJ21_DIBLA|nr:unnamed protein product [Dibothriocephalus latus]
MGVIKLKYNFNMTSLPCGIIANTILYYDDKRNYTKVLIPYREETDVTGLIPGVTYHFRVSADCIDRPASFTQDVAFTPKPYGMLIILQFIVLYFTGKMHCT